MTHPSLHDASFDDPRLRDLRTIQLLTRLWRSSATGVVLGKDFRPLFALRRGGLVGPWPTADVLEQAPLLFRLQPTDGEPKRGVFIEILSLMAFKIGPWPVDGPGLVWVRALAEPARLRETGLLSETPVTSGFSGTLDPGLIALERLGLVALEPSPLRSSPWWPAPQVYEPEIVQERLTA